MKITVLSDGAWATAVSMVLVSNRHEVTMWSPFPANILTMKETGRNQSFFKDFELPKALQLSDSMGEAIAGSEIIILASPTQYARGCLEQLHEIGVEPAQIIVNLAKGIEIGTLNRMSELCEEILGATKYAVLSGPSHAEEVALKTPTAVVVASGDKETAGLVQQVFMNDSFRVYTSNDVVGVELGGALKNVFAIAAGICDGMGLGDNSKAALITRGIAELARLGAVLGGDPETFAGLSGLGDMIVTCASRHSRNRHVGEELGRGVAMAKITEDMGMVVAEGIGTTNSAYNLAKSYNVEVPIVSEVYAGLYEGKDLRQGVRDLMTRSPKSETQ